MVSRRLSATGIRFSVILARRGVEPSSRSAYRDEPGPRRGFRVPHIRAATGVGALCAPGTAVLFPDRSHFPAGACRIAAARPCTPPVLPIDGVRA